MGLDWQAGYAYRIDQADDLQFLANICVTCQLPGSC
jgi:hypothetical protein